MSAWRAAGLNYINYSTIAARILRNALKKEFQVDAEKRALSTTKFTTYVDGKPQKSQEPPTPTN